MLTRIFSASVLLVHHTGKDTSRGGRGASAFKAPLTTELLVERKGNRVVLSQSKSRGAADEGRGIDLSFESHSWKQNGVEQSAGIVAPMSKHQALEFGEDLLTEQQQEVLTALIELHFETESEVSRKEWHARCGQVGVEKRRVNEHIRALVGYGHVREVIKGKTYLPAEDTGVAH